MLSNRESARRSRRRKQEHLNTMEEQVLPRLHPAQSCTLSLPRVSYSRVILILPHSCMVLLLAAAQQFCQRTYRHFHCLSSFQESLAVCWQHALEVPLCAPIPCNVVTLPLPLLLRSSMHLAHMHVPPPGTSSPLATLTLAHLAGCSW